MHAQRVVRRYTTSRPRTDAGRTIYQLALKPTRISTIDQASQWGAQLREFASVYRSWLDEKTLVKDPQTGRWTRTWTNASVRKALQQFEPPLAQQPAVCLPQPTRRSPGPGPRKVDTSGVSYAAWVSVVDVSASKASGARRLHQECRLRVL